MSFPRDAYPYTNFHELNLGYFIVHFREIFSQWADLYDQMLSWKDATDEELARWKAGVEDDLDQREAALKAELETWKAQTGQDIAGWENATLAALTAWKTATQAVFEAIRVEAAGSATAAAASAGDAATAKTAAETAQAAAEAAAASIASSAAQITTNTEDIADLKTQLSDIVNLEPLESETQLTLAFGQIHQKSYGEYYTTQQTCFNLTKITRNDYDSLTFDDDTYKVAFVSYLTNGTYKNVGSWISTSPVNIASISLTGDFYCVEFRRQDGTDLTTTDLNNIDAVLKKTIENKIATAVDTIKTQNGNADYSVISGLYVNYKGEIAENATYNLYSAYVPSKSKIVGKIANSNNGLGYIWFYDINGNTIGSGYRNPTSGTFVYNYDIVVPDGACYVRLSHRNDQNIDFAFDIADRVDGLQNLTAIAHDNKTKLASVSAFVSTSGDDSNDGSLNSPYATVTHAVKNGAEYIHVLPGVYEEQIDLINGKDIISISAYNTDNNKVVFKDPKRIKISSASLMQGSTKIYTANITNSIASDNKWLFQENVADASTLISDAERHPLERGLAYRCDDTRIYKAASDALDDAIAEIEASDNYLWFYNSSESKIYFSSPTAPSSNNPICAAIGSTFFKNPSQKQTLIVTGIDTKYFVFNLSNTINSKISDCKAANVFGAGAFVYDYSINATFLRCEASTAQTGSTGDGFNAHSRNTGNPHSKQTTATLIDCWAHDNNDDGYSDHERSETSVFGGLFEYNQKGGVVPSFGSHCTCYNVTSRNNINGFYYIGVAEVSEGGKYGQLFCVNCLAENNSENGFRVRNNNNILIAENCRSIGNNYGYKCDPDLNNIMYLTDCYALDNTSGIKDGYSSHYVIKNTQIVQ